ncbi:hypothetical protein [Pedobacter nototheniae]|uniref:hypothetical protein n=1 Tax=Pedobacter nototheniae TaxID=2488994 RepID=UPI00103B79D7|nr:MULTISPECIES: hypothetical protein [Pedobacter]
MIKLKRSLPETELNEIKPGHFVQDEHGKSGIVEKIEIFKKGREIQYYYKLSSGETILILK